MFSFFICFFFRPFSIPTHFIDGSSIDTLAEILILTYWKRNGNEMITRCLTQVVSSRLGAEPEQSCGWKLKVQCCCEDVDRYGLQRLEGGR
jgi:hypothetical protein